MSLTNPAHHILNSEIKPMKWEASAFRRDEQSLV